MIYFSDLITEYEESGEILRAVEQSGEQVHLLHGAKDIWLRDFMPVKGAEGQYVSFRYQPSYLKEKDEPYRTDFKKDVASEVPEITVRYSDIRLDGGNVVLSPSGRVAMISTRAFSENPGKSREVLQTEIERLLGVRVEWIEALRSDFTGHADGMVRFLTEQAVLINHTEYKNGLEQRQKKALQKAGFEVIEFPYVSGKGAVGSYLNFLITERSVLLPVFGLPEDKEAVRFAESVFEKPVIPVPLAGIAREGGCLNCISWQK